MGETTVNTCRQCNKPFETDRPRTQLCDACKKANHRTDSRRKYENGIGAGPIKDTPRPAKPILSDTKAKILDKKQFHHDASLDAKLYADCSTSPVKVIKPGDPDFEKVAREVTPITKIRHREYLLFPLQYHYLENGGFKRA